MPDRIARIERERTVKTLAKNLLPAEASAADLRRAEAALLKANPQLARPEGFRPGAPVVTPGDLGIAWGDRVETAETSLAGLTVTARARLEAADAAVRAAFDAEEKARDRRKAVLGDSAFRKAVEQAGPVAEQLAKQAAATLEKAAAAAPTRLEAFTKGLAGSLEEIERLRALAEKRG
jgi:hypothetical protein